MKKAESGKSKGGERLRVEDKPSRSASERRLDVALVICGRRRVSGFEVQNGNPNAQESII